ncbi:MAG: beta-lactamase family protein [Saprospiraceae bacterium]|nr:beta-lactamase family protein [Saprospiraceae bacterium]
MPNNNTLYEIGSITKTFTGLLLAQAVFEKKIDLMADIRQYLPEKYPNLTFEEHPILIQHLANHTAGLTSFPYEDIAAKPNFDAQNPYKHYTSDHALAHLHTVKLERKPGEKAEYSNFATGLMGIILEKYTA